MIHERQILCVPVAIRMFRNYGPLYAGFLVEDDGSGDRPLFRHGVVALAFDIARIEQLARVAELQEGARIVFDERVKDPPELDFPKALAAIRSDSIDNECRVLNCINTSSDIINSLDAAKATMPRRCKDVLSELARHITFQTRMDTFFEDASWTRSEAEAALTWVLGAIVANSEVQRSTISD